MRSKFAIAGHPLHPALVALPIGLFIWSFIAILVYAASDDDRTWYDISYYSAIAAVITALVAALPGFGDLVTLALKHERTRAPALVHMALNLSVVALFAIAALLMYDEGALEGGSLSTVVVLQAIAVGMLALSGWIGGELVFRHHLAVLPEGEDIAEADRAARDLRPHARGR